MRQSASADAYAAVTGRTAGDKLENVVPHSGLIIRSSIDFDIRLIPPRGPCQRGFCKEFIPVEWIPKEPTLDAEAGVKAALNGGFLVAGIGPAKDCPNINYPLLSLSELLAIEGHPA